MCKTFMTFCLMGGVTTSSTGTSIELLVETPFLVRFRLLWAFVPLAPRFSMEGVGGTARYVSGTSSHNTVAL